MSLRRPLLVALITVFLVGCASQKVWMKNGSTQQDFYMDQGQCKAQGFSVASGTLVQAAMVFNACMQGKGWYLENPSDSSAHGAAALGNDNPFRKQWLADTAICKQRHEDGTYKTFAEFAICRNQANEQYAKASNYQRMDQLYAFAAARLQLATQVDEGKLTEAEYNEEVKSMGAKLLQPSN